MNIISYSTLHNMFRTRHYFLLLNGGFDIFQLATSLQQLLYKLCDLERCFKGVLNHLLTVILLSTAEFNKSVKQWVSNASDSFDFICFVKPIFSPFMVEQPS